MRYFIAYAFQDKEKDAIEALRVAIAKKFSVREALKMPPHITLFYPFETNNIISLQNTLESFAKTQPSIELQCLGFSSFDQAVWFLDIEQKPELFSLKTRIVEVVEHSLDLLEERNGHDIHFHCTLAYKDVSPEVFTQIGLSIKQEVIPITHFLLNNLTLFQYSEVGWAPLAVFHLTEKF